MVSINLSILLRFNNGSCLFIFQKLTSTSNIRIIIEFQKYRLKILEDKAIFEKYNYDSKTLFRVYLRKTNYFSNCFKERLRVLK